jgi:hypothetical protein
MIDRATAPPWDGAGSPRQALWCVLADARLPVPPRGIECGPRGAHARTGIGMYHNLTHRPAKPALGRGRVQKGAQRALWEHDGVCTTSQAAQYAYARKILSLERRLGKSDYRYVRRALARIADPIGRAGGSARPIIWRLRDQG